MKKGCNIDFSQFVKDMPNFPKPGVLFRDISPLLSNAAVFDQAIETLGRAFQHESFEAFVGIESRGFILASALAQKFKKGFIPCRKAGKLPPPTKAVSYKLEYGEACIEMALGQGRVVVVDDVLATGGTLDAAIQLCHKTGFEVLGATVLIDLQFLNNYRFNNKTVPSLIQYK